MRTSTKTYTIAEYGSFTRGGASLPGYTPLPEKTFDALEAFILSNQSADGAAAAELLGLSVRRSAGKIITARSFVGLITMNDGTTIEILPKIAGQGVSESDARRVFLQMLGCLKDIPFKFSPAAGLDTGKLSLREIFIRMFIDEVFVITGQGLKSDYTAAEGNERFCKGKLLTAQHIRQNLVRKDRFFVRYDEFSADTPENRLIKTTLSFLRKQSEDSGNRRSLVRLLACFEGAGFSSSIDADFSGCAPSRSMSRYGKAISWCRVFLRGQSFTTFSGSEVAFALLFPMERVFESFVAAKLRKHVRSGVQMRTQDRRYSLFDRPGAFALSPDIVLEREGPPIVLDTKWKLLSGGARNLGISQSDMYQMYAYGKKYKAERVILLYPYSELVSGTGTRYCAEDGVTVDIRFIDLLGADDSILRLLADVG